MKIQQYKASEEKTLVTALIVHDGILSRIHAAIGKRKKPFKSAWSNQIAKWCFDYFSKFKKAPRGAIRNLFEEYAQSNQDPERINLIEKFLSDLSSSYRRLSKEMNEDYLVHLASNYFEKVRAERVSEALEAAVRSNDVEEIRKVFSEYDPIRMSSRQFLSLASNQDIQDVFKFNLETSVMIHLPGDLGKFLSPLLQRDQFIAFAGPEKIGKSYWLMEMVYRALRGQRRVLYYVLGDMSARQVRNRFYRRISGRPANTELLKIPISIRRDGKDEAGLPRIVVECKEERRKGLTSSDVRKCRNMFNAKTGTKEMRIRFVNEGADVISASDVERDVKNLSQQGWVPDVVVIDYADVLLPELSTRTSDMRDQIFASWKILRRIALDYHLLMITATQVAARGYDKWLLTQKDFSEDKRKNGQVSGMIGINQTSEEKKRGIYRLNWINLREGGWSSNSVCTTAGNLAIACPCLKSLL